MFSQASNVVLLRLLNKSQDNVDTAVDLTGRAVSQSERWQFQAVKCQVGYKRLARQFRRLQKRKPALK